jgi:uncharacterized membrane protein YhhN
MNAGAWLTAASVCALLASKRRGWRAGEWTFKPLASTGFLLSAWQHGALDSAYGRAVAAALAASWCGDVLLIPKMKRAFLLGLGAFLLGHVAFAAAFVLRGVSWPVSLAVAAALSAPLALVGRWLMPHVPRAMKLPVMAYMTVITAMVALSFGTASARGDARIAVGALGFYLSDLSVARDRFVAPGFANKLWGWPLYFGAQLVLAATVAP